MMKMTIRLRFTRMKEKQRRKITIYVLGMNARTAETKCCVEYQIDICYPIISLTFSYRPPLEYRL